MDKKPKLTLKDFERITTNKELLEVIHEKKVPFSKVKKELKYEEELKYLQIELVKLQNWVAKNNKRVAVIFEGRDAAGKGGNIRRFMEHLNPRSSRLVALNKPTELERGQWYFQRYIKELPDLGEIVFFDRSWYNRAVVEPVDGIVVIKFWLSISKEEQLKRFEARKDNPLKRWKFSPVDKKGQQLWSKYTYYKREMFTNTHTTYCPWTIIKTNNKKTARLEAIRHVLSKFDYEDKEKAIANLSPDPNVVMRYYRSIIQND